MTRPNVELIEEGPAEASEDPPFLFDFFECRDRMSKVFAATECEFEGQRKVQTVATLLTPSARRIDRFEVSFYWLLSAATLVDIICWAASL